MATFDQILERLDVGDCWVWMGAHNEKGYGVVRYDGQARRVHRVVWQELVGPIPDGLTVDHFCMVRDCANPDHLRLLSQGDNVRASVAATKNHPTCGYGHNRSGDNLYIAPDGKRYCRECGRRNMRAYRKRRRIAMVDSA